MHLDSIESFVGGLLVSLQLIFLSYFLLFIESLLSLKKSKLLQLLDNEEGTIINFPAEVNETTPLYEQENETVSETFLLTLSFYKLYISH